MKERLKRLLDSQAKKEKASSFLSIIGHEYDENYFSRLLVRNSAPNPIGRPPIKIGMMELMLNSTLKRDGKNYYVHILSSKKNDRLTAFHLSMVHEYLFKKIVSPISADEF